MIGTVISDRLPIARRMLCYGLRSLTGFVLLCQFLIWPFPGAAASMEKIPQDVTPKILILDSYHYGYNWSTEELKGLIARLREVYPTIEPSIESLDSKRHPENIHTLRMKDMLREKYRDHEIDLVVALDNPALELLLQHRQELFGEKPVVFGGVNNFSPSMLENQTNITGVAELMDMRQTLEIALKLHPHVKRVLVVHDYMSSALAVRREMESLIPKFADRIDVQFTEPLSFDEAVNRMRSLSSDSMGLILSFITDRLGRSVPLTQSTQILSEVTSQPVYAMHETRLGHGIVGGMLISGVSHGARVADIALRILAGEDADGIPVDMTGGSRPMFDFAQIQRFGINLKDLPESSVIINKPVSFYEQHRTLTVGTITAVLVLLGIVLMLSVAIIKLRRSHKELASTRDSLSKSVKELEIRAQINTILLTFPDERMYEELLEFLLKIMDCAFGFFGYFDDDGLFVAPALSRQAFWEQCNIPEKDVLFKKISLTGIWAQSIRDKKTLIRNEGDFSVPDGHIEISNVIVTPVIFNDLVIGSINLANKPGGFGALDAHLLEMIGHQVAPVLFHRLERDRKEFDRSRAEKLLCESEARFELAMDATDEGLWDWDVQSNSVYFSPGWSRNLGYSENELDQAFKTWESRIHPDDHVSTIRLLQDHIKGRSFMFLSEHRLLTKDGRWKWVLGKGKAVQWDEEGAISRVVGTMSDIDYRKTVEKALLESENRFKAIFDNHHAVMLLVDPHSGKILDANRSAEQFYGYEREKLLNMEISHINIMEPWEIKRQMQNAFTKHNNYFIFQHRLASGEIRIVEVHSSPIDVQGAGLLFSIIHDISDRKKAEDELEQSQHFLEQIIENIPDMIFVKDVDDLRFVRFNRAGEDLLGYSREDLLGKNDYDFFPKEQADFFTAKDREVISKGILTEIVEEEIDTRHKGKRILRTKKIPVTDSSGTPQFLLGISTDISEQKHAQDNLENAYIRLRQIFESISGLILIIDVKTYEILYANKFSEDSYGKPLEGGICYEKLNNLDAPCQHCSISQVIELNGQPSHKEYFNERLNKHLYMTERIIKWPDGRDVKFQFSMDMTDFKKSEKEKEHLQSQLLQSQKMEAIGTLAGGIAHDFNNLLQVVLGYSEILLERKEKKEPDYKDIQKIYQAGKRGAELVKNLLTFSRRVEPQYVMVDVNQQITALRSLLSRTIPKNINIDLRLSNDLNSILADSSQIDQILMNLAVNARDAMPDGGTITIETANVRLDEDYCRKNLKTQPGDYVVISLADTGHGIPKEMLEHIFEPFFSTKEVGKGTGLGLATVYGIVTQLKGHITCHSDPGTGATFIIHLPSVPAPKDPIHKTAGQTPTGGSETILLVDD